MARPALIDIEDTLAFSFGSNAIAQVFWHRIHNYAQKMAFSPLLAELTLMVNNDNLSLYDGTPPKEGCSDGERQIACSHPLYEKAGILAAMAANLVPWTAKCIKEIQDLEFEIEDVEALVKDALTSGRYTGSEWCIQKKGGKWAACDVYVVNRMEWCAPAHKELSFQYYVKFGIARTGKALLIISCHWPQTRR